MAKLAPPLVLLALCYALLFGYVGLTYHELPPMVASHFDIEGQPNGWMSRHTCVAFTLGLGVLLPAMIVGMMGGAGKIPVSFVNLPHRDYWMEPARREAALSTLLRQSLWFASLTVLFVTGLHWLIVRANLPGQNPHLSGMGILLIAGGYIAGTLIWSRQLVRRFSKIT